MITTGYCILDGTVYAEGSAMRSSTLCQYCFCIRGEMKCSSPQVSIFSRKNLCYFIVERSFQSPIFFFLRTKFYFLCPQCVIPLNGCKPRFRSYACCPTNYDCGTSDYMLYARFIYNLLLFIM